MMNNLPRTLAFILAFLSLASCATLEPDVPAVPEERGLAAGETGMYIAPVTFADNDGTRAVMDITDAGLSFRWEDTDEVGVYSQAGGFARFSLISGSGSASAVFDGMGFDLTPGSTYNAFFPYALSATDPSAVAISFDGQKALADNDMDSVMDFDYLAASAQADDTGRASFHFAHLGAFLRLRLTLPAGTPIDKVEFVPMYDPIPVGLSVDVATGTQSVTETAVTLPVTGEGLSAPAEGPFTLWTALPAKDYADDDFAVLVHSGSDMYSARHTGANFTPGSAFRWKAAPLKDADPDYGFASVNETGLLNPSEEDVPSGQYSGITWMGGTQYAVVHDKYDGGGIVYFDIVIDDTGAVTSVTSSIPEGTSSSTITKRDNEGIAYVPGNPGTLFVSAEKDQSIREYNLKGTRTGRLLTIPADLKKSLITKNRGFEALTYNHTTGLFWTVTEAPLLKDAPLGNILRLQSFSGSTRKPGDRFLYRMDEPMKTADEASAAKSYVFGVPALAALDDGRLLVLEREVYVPKGSGLDLLSAFTNINIYAVNPSADGAGILRKTLVKNFSTGAFNLGNYEGMCVGPTLSDGSVCLVLVPDTQADSRVLEFVKVITVK